MENKSVEEILAEQIAKDAESKRPRDKKGKKGPLDLPPPTAPGSYGSKVDKPDGEPPHLRVTYQGQYHENAGNGNKPVSFEETVKVPMGWVTDSDIHPYGVFKKFYAPIVLSSKPGYNGVRKVHLKSVEAVGEIEDHVPLEQILRWTASYSDLCRFADRYAKEVNPLLYPHPDELRHAISQYMKEPEAFKRLQGKKMTRDSKAIQMKQELAALGYGV